jgi:hypothetical protein
VSAESELELRIAAFDPAQFERLVYDIVLEENPDAVKLAAPELGADMLVLASDGQPPRVWQAKRFTGRPNWRQCEKSLRDAIAGYGPQRVTFVFARDLTGPQLKTFEARLVAIGAAAGVKVDHWGLSAVRSHLQRSSFLQVRYFGHDQETMLDITARRRIHADPVLQAFNVRDAFGLDDPDFEFSVDLLSKPLPEPEVVAGASVTFVFKEGSQTLSRHERISGSLGIGWIV